jgi:hypothetical protein
MTMVDPAELFSNMPEDAGYTSFDDSPLPEGVYPLVVESVKDGPYIDGVPNKPEAIADALSADSSLKPGRQISITYVVAEGKFAKRKLFGRYCVQPSSNQRTYGDFTPDKKRANGLNDLAGLRIRFGTPKDWSDWIGKSFNGYVTAKKGKDEKIRNEVRCTIKKGEENAPRPSSVGTTPVASDEDPF